MYLFASSLLYCIFFSLALCAEELLHALDKRIYDGYAMPQGQAPYAASLLIEKSSTAWFVCGATFISPEYLITAAHCLESGASPYQSSYKLIIGYNDVDKTKQTTVQTTQAWPHPKYIVSSTSEDALYDMAILKVPAVSGTNTARALIYTGDVNAGDTVLAVGWGGSEDAVTNKSLLRAANLIVGDTKTCQSFMGDVFTGNNNYMVCTLSSKTPGVGICGGDSGSSIMYKDGGVEKFLGISSRIYALGTLTCGGSNTASFFTNVHLYLDFITEKTGLTKEYLTGESASTTTTTAPKPTATPSPSEAVDVVTVTDIVEVTVTDWVSTLPW